jgi:iron complex transport system substrate-binding protein
VSGRPQCPESESCPLPPSSVSRTNRGPGLAMPSVLVALLFVVAACAAPGTSPTPAQPTTAAPVTPSPAAETPSPTPPTAFPVTVTDDDGVEVTLDAEPGVIVSLTPAVTETLFALGVGDRIAGKVEDFFLFPSEAAGIPDVARYDGVDIEQVVGLEPDVVIAGGNFITPPDAIARMRELGLTVVVVHAPTPEAVMDDIELIGSVVGRSAEAAAIADRMRGEFAAVEAALAGVPRPRVFYELDATGAIYGPAQDSFLARMIELAGGDPITTGSPERYEISIERLIEADPELILLADAPFGVTPEQVAARPGWEVMTAVQTPGAIRPIDDETISRPGPRLFVGLQLLARTIHPDQGVPSSDPIPPVP